MLLELGVPVVLALGVPVLLGDAPSDKEALGVALTLDVSEGTEPTTMKAPTHRRNSIRIAIGGVIFACAAADFFQS